MYKVVLADEAIKQYKKQNDETKRRINKCIDNLQENPFFGLHIKKLHGELEGSYRYRIGNIRVVYSIDILQKIVKIYAIKPRGDIY